MVFFCFIASCYCAAGQKRDFFFLIVIVSMICYRLFNLQKCNRDGKKYWCKNGKGTLRYGCKYVIKGQMSQPAWMNYLSAWV